MGGGWAGSAGVGGGGCIIFNKFSEGWGGTPIKNDARAAPVWHVISVHIGLVQWLGGQAGGRGVGKPAKWGGKPG